MSLCSSYTPTGIPVAGVQGPRQHSCTNSLHQPVEIVSLANSLFGQKVQALLQEWLNFLQELRQKYIYNAKNPAAFINHFHQLSSFPAPWLMFVLVTIIFNRHKLKHEGGRILPGLVLVLSNLRPLWDSFQHTPQ